MIEVEADNGKTYTIKYDGLQGKLTKEEWRNSQPISMFDQESMDGILQALEMTYNGDFFENNDYFDCDLYEVTRDDDGNKVVHILGYVHRNESGYQCVQPCWCYLYIEDGITRDDANDMLADVKQYQYDYTEQEAMDFYDGATPLPYERLTDDTPFGLYVDCKEKED